MMSREKLNHVSLLGAPIDAGAGRRGCMMGPASFRTVGIVDELTELGLYVVNPRNVCIRGLRLLDRRERELVVSEGV